MLSLEPARDAKLLALAEALALEALVEPDAALLALAADEDAAPDEQPATMLPPAMAAPAKPASLKTSRLVYALL